VLGVVIATFILMSPQYCSGMPARCRAATWAAVREHRLSIDRAPVDSFG
jgi:hypothetical protein